MKVLDAESLHHGLQETILALDHLNTQIKGIQKAVDGFLHLENDFKGQGAEAIRSFYRECHVPLLLFMEGFLWDYQDILKQIQKSLQSFDPHQRAFIRQDFLEQELQQGIRKAKNVTMDITNAVNASLRSVNDLVSLPSIDDGAFLHRMDQSKEKIQATLEQLHQFDRQSTSRLEKAEKDLSLMQNYIREINSMIRQGGLSVVTYSPRKLQDLEIHQVLINNLRKKAGKNAFSLDTLAQSVLSRYVPLSEILIKHLHEKYNRRTMDYSVRAFQAITAAGNNVISQNEFTALQGSVIKSVEVTDYLGERHGNYLTLSDGRMLRTYEDSNGRVNYRFVTEIPESRLKPEEKNAFQKSVDSFQELGSDILDGFQNRWEKATDSPYDFGNYLTSGLLDLGKNSYSGLQYNAENMFHSPKDFVNWATIGSVDLVQSAVIPEESFSKEHWLASFGIATTFGGVRGVSAPKTKPSTPKSGATVSPTKSGVATSPVTAAPKLPTLTNIREWYRVHMPEIGLVQNSMGGYHFVVRKGEGGGVTKGIDNVAKPYVSNPYNSNGNLKTNVKYKSGEYNYSYETDNLGRISKFETDNLQFTTRENRLSHNPNTPGKQPGDHAGHLAGDRFGGSPELDNLVSQSSNINLSQYKKLENQWANAIKDGKQVYVNVKIEYSGNSSRPSTFNVQYEIDGERFIKDLLN